MALREGKPVVLSFGGGLNTRASPTAVNAVEATAGKNYDLDFQNKQFGKRKSFAAVASAPNGSGIRGFVQLEKADKTRSFLIQAGNIVYEWDGTSGSSGMTSVATVNANARLRGSIEMNSIADDTVLIADLNLVETVKTWNGTTFAALSHNLGGNFLARYIQVENERTFFGNVQSGTATPHLLLASAREDFTNLTTSDRPVSSLGAGDPFFLPMPNLRPVNGLITAFGRIVAGTRGSNFYELLGEDSKDHSLSELASISGNEGEEGIVFADNDILYSRRGAIDSVGATATFGDVETDDLTRWIQGNVRDIASWTMEYSSRFKKLYAFPSGGGRVHVLHKSFIDEVNRGLKTGEFASNPVPRLSPWSIWETADSFNFEPTATQRMFRPTDGLEFIYMGGGDGTLYQLEAETGGDPNSNDIVAERTSAAFTVPPGEVFDVVGWVRYKQGFSGTLTITFEFGGENVFDESVSVTLGAASNNIVFNGTDASASVGYFSGDVYFNTSFGGRLTRAKYTSAGKSDQIQVKASVTGSADFFIEEIGIEFNEATA